jgi:hypothetical protein
MSGAIRLLPQYAFMAWTGTTLSLHFYHVTQVMKREYKVRREKQVQLSSDKLNGQVCP